jgi:hypothetical protein
VRDRQIAARDAAAEMSCVPTPTRS